VRIVRASSPYNRELLQFGEQLAVGAYVGMGAEHGRSGEAAGDDGAFVVHLPGVQW
jgi:hypothetical protein